MGRKQTSAAAAKAAGTAAKAESTGQAKREAPGGKRRPEASRTAPGPTATPPNLDTLRVSCLLNAQYHASREAFLDFVHRWFMFAIILLGAGAVIELLSDKWDWLRNVIGIMIAALGALDLTFDLSNRARTHSLMKRRYFELLADVQDGLKSKSVAEACLNRFSADEEPAYHALVKLSWNAAQEMVYGDDAQQYKVPARHRFLKNICRFASSNYPLKNPPN